MRSVPATRRRRDDAGAVAIIVAVLSVVLFSCAALSVDLGNAWARKRDLQKQADVAVMAAARALPVKMSDTGARTRVVEAAASSLLANPVSGQDLPTTADGIALTLENSDAVTFLDGTGAPCTELCTQIQLTVPSARVDFSFARVMGQDGTNVTRSATAEVMSGLPPRQKMIPFWLPSGCGLGPAYADSTGGSADATAALAPASAHDSYTDAVALDDSATSSRIVNAALATGNDLAPPTLSGPTLSVPSGTTETVTGLTVADIPSKVDRASIRFVAPDGHYIEYAATDVVPPLFQVPSFEVGTEVTNVPGVWSVYAVVEQRGNDNTTLSSNSLTFTVTGSAPSPDPTSSPSTSPSPDPTDPTTQPAPTDPSSSATSTPVDCVGQNRGNFGELDSPRKDATQRQEVLARNLALGPDHQFVPYDFGDTTPSKDCGSPNKPLLPGAAFDDEPIDGRNCIKGDTGNDGPGTYEGLISGVGAGVPGRLDASVSGRSTSAQCAAHGRQNAEIGGVPINNDVLSCYLRNGATLDSLASPTGVTPAMLDPAVVDSARFVWLPVVVATDRAQKDYQPILDFAPAFITDETQVNDAGAQVGSDNSNATAANGLQVSGNSVKSMQVFVFNKAALPLDAQTPTVAYSDTYGDSVVRLVG